MEQEIFTPTKADGSAKKFVEPDCSQGSILRGYKVLEAIANTAMLFNENITEEKKSRMLEHYNQVTKREQKGYFCVAFSLSGIGHVATNLLPATDPDTSKVHNLVRISWDKSKSLANEATILIK